MDTRPQEFMELHESGKTYQEIGDMHGISKERVRQIIRKEYPSTSRELSARIKVRGNVVLDNVNDINSAMLELGSSYAVARSELIRRGIKYMKATRTDPDKIARYIGYSSQGLTTNQVASIEGIRQPCVSAFCKKHVIKLKDGRKA